MKKSIIALLLCAFLMCFCLVFASCEQELDSSSQEQNEFTVTFDSNGGTAVDPQEVKRGEKATEPSEPTRDGYKFEGWYASNVKWSFDLPVSTNLTLKAKWTEIVTYTVTFNSNGGTAVTSQKIEKGSTILEPTAPKKDGYKFDGWYLGEDKWSFDAKVTDNIELTAKWTEYITYTVTFISDGGNAVSPQKVEKGAMATQPIDPKKNGYTFDGWFLGEDKWSFDTAVSANITLRAKWTKTIYIVTFDSNGGNAVSPQQIGSGEKATEPTPPTRDGYVFDGWYLGENKWSFDSAITANITLDAKWTSEKVTIVFDYDDYSGVVWDDDFDEEMVVNVGERVGDFPVPTIDGNAFLGWYRDLNDETTKLRKTTMLDGSEARVVYYAKFTYNCAAGAHNWNHIMTDPTCTLAGTKKNVCEICNFTQVDAIYSTVNGALGHKWVEDGQTGDGWSDIALARTRTCLRNDCDYSETMQLKNLTPLGEMTVSIDAGAWPGTAEWPGILTDGEWDINPNSPGVRTCCPKGGGPLTITILFNQAQDVDQIAMSVKGWGEDGLSSKFAVYLYYADENEFNETAVATGAFLQTTCTRETAVCIDLSKNTRKVLGVKIVQEKTLMGSEYFKEIAVGQIPEED